MDVTANSGSPADIQVAVNSVVATGGGNVTIPAGDFTFRPAVNGAVVINVPNNGINIFGAGKGNTILRADIAPPDTNTIFIHFNIQSNGKPFRVSGISFLGNVNNDAAQNIGIRVSGAKDFRIDNCQFQDFTDQAIITWGCKGLIDHCDIDNPYKDRFPPKSDPNGQPWAVWGYGIIVIGANAAWNPDITSLLGKYETVPASSSSQPIYIEDCTFNRCRHAIDSNTNGFYVSRHNHFQKSSPYPQNNSHGGAPGTRLYESYDNEFDLTDESYSSGQDAANCVRGGAAMIFGNLIRLNKAYPTSCLMLLNDGSAPYDDQKIYAWSNTVLDQNGNSTPYTVNAQAGIVENVNYFLRQPNQAQDGFTYTPYVYPHPLASGVVPPPPTQYQTPFLGALEEGVYKVTVPLSIVSGSDMWLFKQWEDGSTNPVRQVTLNQNLSLMATYALGTIIINVVAGTGGTVTPSGSQTLTVGQAYSFNAIPTSGYVLDHWDLGGTNLGSTNPLTLSATEDMNGKTLTALFTTIPPVQITMNLAITGKGTTNPTSGSHIFNIGDSVQLTAIPNAGYSFTKWTLNGTTYTDNPLTLVITESMNGQTLTAEFTGPPTPITSAILPAGIIIISVAGVVYYLATRKKR